MCERNHVSFPSDYGPEEPRLHLLRDGAWARPRAMERGEAQAALLAVLKAHRAPMCRGEAKYATMLCLEPHLLVTPDLLDQAETAEWVRVVGDEAKTTSGALIDGSAQALGASLSGLRGRGRLVEDLEWGTWALGAGTSAVDTSGWPDGRARFVVAVLQRARTRGHRG